MQMQNNTVILNIKFFILMKIKRTEEKRNYSTETKLESLTIIRIIHFFKQLSNLMRPKSKSNRSELNRIENVEKDRPNEFRIVLIFFKFS